MNWIVILDIVYIIILVLVCLRIIYDTNSTHKTLAYLLLAIFIPILGMLFYFSFGINYRKRRVYSKKLIEDDALRGELIREVIEQTELNLKNHTHTIGDAKGLVHLLLKDNFSPLSTGNFVKLLLNGEEKFREVYSDVKRAKQHIYIQYYIYEYEIE